MDVGALCLSSWGIERTSWTSTRPNTFHLRKFASQIRTIRKHKLTVFTSDV